MIFPCCPTGIRLCATPRQPAGFVPSRRAAAPPRSAGRIRPWGAPAATGWRSGRTRFHGTPGSGHGITEEAVNPGLEKRPDLRFGATPPQQAVPDPQVAGKEIVFRPEGPDMDSEPGLLRIPDQVGRRPEIAFPIARNGERLLDPDGVGIKRNPG